MRPESMLIFLPKSIMNFVISPLKTWQPILPSCPKPIFFCALGTWYQVYVPGLSYSFWPIGPHDLPVSSNLCCTYLNGWMNEWMNAGASSGFQPNQGKNTRFYLVVKIVSFKCCFYFTQALQKSFNVLDILPQTYRRLTISYFFIFWWKTAF